MDTSSPANQVRDDRSASEITTPVAMRWWCVRPGGPPPFGGVGSVRDMAGGTAHRFFLFAQVMHAVQSLVMRDYSRIDPEAIELAAGARDDTGQGRRVESCRGATFAADRGRLVQTDGLRLRDTATVLEVTFGRCSSC